jgi:hypothetical protein
MLTLARLALSFLAAIAVAACSGGSAPVTPAPSAVAPTAAPSPSPVAVAAATPVPGVSSSPTTFTSKTYGYSLTLPAGWTSIQATAAWDGQGAPSHDVPEADQLVGPGAASAWFFGAPTTSDLAAQVKATIAGTATEHSECPPVPDVTDPITIGGDPGTLLAFDCGILINNAISIHDGKAYVFGFRDPAVHAATDPTDRATFLQILESVDYPG